MILDRRSEERLKGVHPDLVVVVHRAFDLSPVKFIVTEGLRTIERQRELYAQGRTKPGKIVTGTMKSKHLTGDAVDLAPLTQAGAVTWEEKPMATVAVAMFDAAKELGVHIRWGRNWDEDDKIGERGEYDGPHFELMQ